MTKRKLKVIKRGISAALQAKLDARQHLDEALGTPDLSWYDRIVICTSGGKDSEVQLHVVVQLAKAAGVLDRVVVVHADLGDVEWRGAAELAERQAARYGVRFEVVSRIGGVSAGQARTANGPLYAKGEVYGDLLDYVLHRARQRSDVPPWPSGGQGRTCTPTFKRGPCQAFYTKLSEEWRAENPAVKRPFRLLDCQGMRAQESPSGRGMRPQRKVLKDNANQFWELWLPIKWMRLGQVWEIIFDNDLEYAPSYDLGMPRFSCPFCVFASWDALIIAGIANPELLDRYVAVEDEVRAMGNAQWQFTQKFAIAEVKAAIEAGERPTKAEDWAA